MNNAPPTSFVGQMTLQELRIAHSSGAFTGARIIANGRRFHVVVKDRTSRDILLVRHSDRAARLFSDPTAALRLLRDVGFGSVEMLIDRWQPDQGDMVI
jgi:hypothetical protein